MQIKRIEVFGFDLPVKGKAYTMAKASVTSLDTTLVKITADNGLVGWRPVLLARFMQNLMLVARGRHWHNSRQGCWAVMCCR